MRLRERQQVCKTAPTHCWYPQLHFWVRAHCEFTSYSPIAPVATSPPTRWVSVKTEKKLLHASSKFRNPCRNASPHGFKVSLGARVYHDASQRPLNVLLNDFGVSA